MPKRADNMTHPLLPTSIRRRTLLLVLLLLVSMSALIGVASFRDAHHEIEEIFDARLAQNARILQALVLGIHEAGLETDEEQRLQMAFEQALLAEAGSDSIGHKYESKIAYQVWHGQQLLMRSVNSPPTPISAQTPGFGQIRYQDYQWITFTLKTHSNVYPFTVTVAEREDVRGELVEKVVAQTLLPELIGIPLLALMIWRAIGWGLSPLRELAALIKNRAPDNLKPIRLTRSASELQPIEQALNRLFRETESLIAREQRLIADAAHELRTPLAVLKIHADNARNAADPEDKQQALHQLTAGVDRSSRIVEQLLTLARLDPELSPSQKKTRDLLQLSRQCLADLMPIAWQKQIELSLDADEHVSWNYPLEEGALEILLQNLISNAVKFSPANSSISVCWQQNAQSLQLTVTDQGCGVPQEELSRLTERFYRKGCEDGAGLGLSIVKRLCERHQASIDLQTTPGGGLTVILCFPRCR